MGISTDVTSPESINAAFKKIKELGKGGEVQVAAGVYNVAGGFARKPFLELTLEEWEEGYERGWCVFPR